MMAESYKSNPKPCDTMNVIGIPNKGEIAEISKEKNLRMLVHFPVTYTEIEQEKVRDF